MRTLVLVLGRRRGIGGRLLDRVWLGYMGRDMGVGSGRELKTVTVRRR